MTKVEFVKYFVYIVLKFIEKIFLWKSLTELKLNSSLSIIDNYTYPQQTLELLNKHGPFSRTFKVSIIVL